MDRCEDCMTWLVTCPCCDERFCPGCERTEAELEEEYEDDSETD